MPKCQLTLRLEEERTRYRPGDVVRGTVEVLPDEDVTCKGLTVEAFWRTHGKGSKRESRVVEQKLFEGQLRAGLPVSHRFEFELPSGPFTYHGHYLNVDWAIRARVDVPWALDPKTESEIALVAPERDLEYAEEEPSPPDWSALVPDPALLPSTLEKELGRSDEEASPESSAASARITPGSVLHLGNCLGLGCLAVFAVPLVILFGAAVSEVAKFLRGDGSPLDALIWGLFAVAMLIGFAVLLFKVLRNLVAKRKLGDITFEVEPLLLRAGDPLRLRLFFQPRAAVDLQRATARLFAQEVVVRGSGTNKKTYRHTVFEQESEIAVARTLMAGMPVHLDVTLPLPADAPPSFLAGSNRLEWKVSVHVDIARWPDWIDERTLLVHP